jgi:ABC-type transport system involved in multi-copper enzyme maturation permease subunit
MTPRIARDMISAEVLKLRRNRGLMAFSLLLAVGVVVLLFGFTAIQHATNPSQNAPAGALHGFSRAVRILGLFFGALTAMLIGSEAGTADIASGVFRDLVATGRSRTVLFLVRAPAAVLVTLALTLTGFLIAIAGSLLFADGLPTPGLSLILQSAGWLVLANSIVAVLAVGVGSLTGSRAITLTAVIGWQTIATQLLLNVPSLGSARDGLLTASLGHLMPVEGGLQVPMSEGVAIAVLIAWTAVPALVGAWRTNHQEA